MPLIQVLDAGGSPLTVLNVDGTLLYPFESIEETFRTITSWKARDDDVMICAYAKSGTHWVWELTSMLVRKSAVRIPYPKSDNMLELISRKQFENIESPRILNCHLEFSELPTDFLKRKCKIIYILRNPKDVITSFYHHHVDLKDYQYSGTFGDHLSLFIDGKMDFGAYFDYIPDWERVIKDHKDYPIHVMYYEDLKERPLQEVQRLAGFLDCPEKTELLQAIVEACSFGRMKVDKNHMEMVGSWTHGCPKMYRKGEVGDWRNWFTDEHIKRFDDAYTEHMGKTTIKFRYQL